MGKKVLVVLTALEHDDESLPEIAGATVSPRSPLPPAPHTRTDTDGRPQHSHRRVHAPPRAPGGRRPRPPAQPAVLAHVLVVWARAGSGEWVERACESAIVCVCDAPNSQHHPFSKQGWRHPPLKLEDVPRLPPRLTTAGALPAFQAAWAARAEKADRKPGIALAGALLSVDVVAAVAVVLLQVTQSAFSVAVPLLLKPIITHLQSATAVSAHTAYVCAGLLFVLPLLGALAFTHSSRAAAGIQVRVKTALTAAVYAKAGHLSPSARRRADTDVGRLVQLCASDVATIAQFAYPFASQLISAPLLLITALGLLVGQMGPSALIGVAVMVVSSPFSGACVKRITAARRSMLQHTDVRVRLVGQLIQGIRVLKLYGWTAAQADQVAAARAAELGALRSAVPFRVGMQTLLFAAPVVAAVASFAAFGAVAPNRFTPAVVFSSLALFALMRLPLVLLPFAAVEAGNAAVSARRIGAFLMLPERDAGATEALPEGATGIEFFNASFFWPPSFDEAEEGDKQTEKEDGGASKPDDPPPTDAVDAVAVTLETKPSLPAPLSSVRASTRYGADPPSELASLAPPGTYWLSDIDGVRVGPGELVAIVGRVGAGKSSLLAAALGNMERAAGSVRVGGSIAYAAQQPWIANATLKENVLSFGAGGAGDKAGGAAIDEDAYAVALHAACLEPDLAVLPGGDATEIGERGVTLSGGQKARVALARAYYADADVYVFDDVLSAVDVHVGAALVTRLICALKARGKAILMATNQLAPLAHAAHIVYLENGRIAAVDESVDALRARCPGFAALVADHETSMAAAADATAGPTVDPDPPPSPGRPDDKDDIAFLRARLGDALLPRPTRVDDADTAAPLSPTDSDAAAPLKRVPTAVLTQQSRMEQLHDAVGGGGGGGASTEVPPLERTERYATEADASSRPPAPPRGRLFGVKLAVVLGGRRAKKVTGSAVEMTASKKDGDDTATTTKPSTLVAAETRASGAVAAAVYAFYASAYGRAAFAALFCLWAAEQSARVLTNWWLSRWTAAEAIASTGGPPVDRNLKLSVYFGLSAAFVCITGTRAASNLLSALRASFKIHTASLTAVARAPVSFFDATPAGRILNRFSKDLDDIDQLIPQSINDAGNTAMTLFAALVFESIVQPYFLAGAIPILIAYYFICRFFRATYVELQRNDAVSRSPIFAHLTESVSGQDTLRAAAAQPAYAAASAALVDANNRAYYAVRTADMWLSLRLECVSASLVCLVAVVAISTRGRLSPSLAALALSEACDMTGFLKYFVVFWAQLESRFNAVERLRELARLPSEAPLVTLADATLPAGWPVHGAVVFDNVWLTYRQGLDPALRGVSFSVPAGAKVGICGRTGSGKSSLVVALYRLTEPSRGRVLVDSIDVSTLGLSVLRTRLATIPQDPVLFAGSVRQNLDPYNQHDDAALWSALDVVALKSLVSEAPLGLSERIVEGGENWSVGQRQLLCVARAVLRSATLVVCDEATSSVDAEADALIQKALRTAFADATVLTVAHRVATILDSSSVLVMDGGRAGEYGPVGELLAREGGLFRALVEGAGR